jgi:hypothetical protein
MKLKAFQSLVSLNVVALLFFPNASEAGEARNNGWIIDGCDLNNGNFSSRISNTWLSWVNQTVGYVMVSGPPNGTIYVYNDKKKNYFCYGDGKHASTYRLMKFLNTSGISLHWQKVYSSKYLGHSVDVWRADQYGGAVKTEPGAKFDGYEFWAATDMHINPSVMAMNRAVHGWPDVSAVALRYFHCYWTGKRTAIVDVKSIRPAFVPDSAFRVPKGYKRSENEMEVVTKMLDLGDFFKDFASDPEKK